MNAPVPALVRLDGSAPEATRAILDTLPAMVDRARTILAQARTSAEVLEAGKVAKLAYDMAAGAARFGRAMEAHGSLVSTAWRVQGDAMLIESQAWIRLADEYDAAQARGEVPRHGGVRGGKIPDGNLAPDAGRVDIPLKDLHEARRLRDAAGKDPDLVVRTVNERLAASRAPTRAALRDAVSGAIDPADDIDARMKARHAERQAEKKRKREARIVKLAARTRAAAAEMGRKLFNVLYVDFPWRHATWSAETGMDRAPDNHYPTLSDEEIEAFELPAAAAAVLYMWTPVPKLKVAMRVMEAKGFEYVSLWAWTKPSIGLGYYGRENLELLLIGTRGGMVGPELGKQPPMAQSAPRGRRHSEKPGLFADCIARLYAGLDRIEMFARGPRDGWEVWGNESDGGEP